MASQPASLATMEPPRPPGDPTADSAPSLGILIIVLGTVIRCIPIVAALLKPTGSVPAWIADYAPIPEFDPGSAFELIGTLALIGILVVSILSIIGLLQRRTWGWTLAIVTAVVLALNIGWWASGKRATCRWP